MPRTCTICAHPQREDVDRALLAGDPYRYVSEQFSVSVGALQRHKAAHLPEAMTRAKEAQEVTRADDLLGQLDNLRAEAHRIKDKAEQAGDFRTALTGIRELVRLIELMAKIRGELQEAQTVNIVLMPEWVTIRAALLVALAPFPEARAAAASALLGVDRGQPGR